MPWVRPQASSLRQVEAYSGYGHDGPGVCLGDGQTMAYLKDMDMMVLASAWAMTIRRPKEYRRMVDAATLLRCMLSFLI